MTCWLLYPRWFPVRKYVDIDAEKRQNHAFFYDSIRLSKGGWPQARMRLAVTLN